MAANFTLSPEQLDEFDRRGVLRLTGLFSADRVRRAREHVQLRLARSGLWKNGAWRLSEAANRPQWPDTGLKVSRVIGNKHPDVEALLEEPALLHVVAALLDGHPFDRTIHRRPQVLFTLPNSHTWTVPTHWHVDIPRLASRRRPGVQLFMFLDMVEPRGGGTLVIAGSHRLLNGGQFLKVKEINRRLCQEAAFFRELYGQATVGVGDRAGLLELTASVGDVGLEVMELTGAPGDAYFTDLRVLHTAAPNATDQPRVMATHRFVRADVVREMAEAYGWE
jgi:Phytanoyl-CoA dioxygenase (PhyH)